MKLRRQREGKAWRRDASSIQTGTPFGYWIITGAIELGFSSGSYGWKAKT